jgi:hypothetical protein
MKHKEKGRREVEIKRCGSERKRGEKIMGNN